MQPCAAVTPSPSRPFHSLMATRIVILPHYMRTSIHHHKSKPPCALSIGGKHP